MRRAAAWRAPPSYYGGMKAWQKLLPQRNWQHARPHVDGAIVSQCPCVCQPPLVDNGSATKIGFSLCDSTRSILRHRGARRYPGCQTDCAFRELRIAGSGCRARGWARSFLPTQRPHQHKRGALRISILDRSLENGGFHAVVRAMRKLLLCLSVCRRLPRPIRPDIRLLEV